MRNLREILRPHNGCRAPRRLAGGGLARFPPTVMYGLRHVGSFRFRSKALFPSQKAAICYQISHTMSKRALAEFRGRISVIQRRSFHYAKQLFENNSPYGRELTRPRPFADHQSRTILNVQGASAVQCCS